MKGHCMTLPKHHPFIPNVLDIDEKTNSAIADYVDALDFLSQDGNTTFDYIGLEHPCLNFHLRSASSPSETFNAA